MSEDVNIGNYIRTLRMDKGMTQQALADRLFVTRVTVTNWESGTRIPDLPMLTKLAQVLEVDIYDILEHMTQTENTPVIMVADDESIIRNGFVHIIEDELPQAQVYGFQKAKEAYQFALANKIDVAFLDIELCDGSGVELARKLTELYSRINIIFLTGHTEYAADALDIHCSGYILKPLTPRKLRHELDHLPGFPKSSCGFLQSSASFLWH